MNVYGHVFSCSGSPTPNLLEWDHAFMSDAHPGMVAFIEVEYVEETKEELVPTTVGFVPDMELWEGYSINLTPLPDGAALFGIRVHIRYCSEQWYTYLDGSKMTLQDFLSQKKYLTATAR